MNLPTLTWHFFEKPNKLTITDATFNTIIVAEYECDDDFVLDAKSFDMLKKLGGPVKLEGNTITFNKYKCQNIEVAKPELHLDDIVYTNTYNSSDLKEASKFVGNQQALQGVLLNDNGDVFGTDGYKFYFKRKISPYTRFWSVPIQFIGLLPEGNVELNFTDSKVAYNGDEYKIYSSLYNNKVPTVEKVCDGFIANHTIEIDRKQELTYLPCDAIKLIINNGVHFIFDDNEKQFQVDYDIDTDFEFECKLDYEYFTQALDNHLKIDFSTNALRINDKIIICYMR